MPKAMKNSARAEATVSNLDELVEASQDELSSSEQEQDPEVSLNPCRLPQILLGTFMPYIEGPKMDTTVNDGLYHRSLKWHLKC